MNKELLAIVYHYAIGEAFSDKLNPLAALVLSGCLVAF